MFKLAFLILVVTHSITGQTQTAVIQLTAREVVRDAIQLAISDLSTASAIQSLSEKGSGHGGGNRLQRLFSKRSLNPIRSELLDNQATVAQYTTRNIMISRNIDLSALQRDQGLMTEFGRQIARYCSLRRPVCDRSYPYRMSDGTCNNLLDSLLGSSLTAQQRLINPAYDDEFMEPRTRTVNNGRLPNPRLVSNMMHATGHSYQTSPFVTALFAHWGQFISHDLVHTPSVSMDCCQGSNQQLDKCFGIDIPSGDPRFRNKKCMNFVRSDSVPPLSCKLEPRQQINERTSFLDGSVIYGNDGRQTELLRDFRTRGLLKVSHRHNLLPKSVSDCLLRSTDVMKGFHCFLAGDHRSLASPATTPIQLVFVREHNRIATELGTINRNWTSDVVFQETRKIVSALIQHITYNEFLPIILNNYYINTYNLRSTKEGHNTVYNARVNPAIINSFGAAAFRFGHSLVRNTMSHANENFTIVRTYKTKDTFFSPTSVWEPNGKGADFYARWLTSDVMARPDRFIEPDLRDNLFLDHRTGDALDLAALNIQRGRDHGLPGYNSFRRYCGLSQVYHFGTGHLGLRNHEESVAMHLNQTYRSPSDIDLFTGGLSEIPEEGGIVGPTFSCLIALQFSLLKLGDRFWYENDIPGVGFTTGQLNEIKRQTLTNLLCRNLDIPRLQRAAFIIPSDNNPRLRCDRFGNMSLEYWREISPSMPQVQTFQTVPQMPTVQEIPVQAVPQVQTVQTDPPVQTVQAVPQVQTDQAVPQVQTVQAGQTVPQVQTVHTVPQGQTAQEAQTVQPFQMSQQGVPLAPSELQLINGLL